MTTDELAGRAHHHTLPKGHRSHTPAERAEFGKRARKRTPRSSLGSFSVALDRFDPVSLLEEQALTRVPELVPIRHGRMAVSPFTFFRGAALPMAADLASMPNSDLHVQLVGDAHLLNFGVFGTPERRLVFDINDFDETSVGPFEWDLMRLTASLVLASRERGDSPAITERVVLAAAAAYRTSMAAFAAMKTLDVWYSLFDVDEFVAHLGKARRNRPQMSEKGLRKIRGRDSVKAAGSTTTMVDGEPRFVANPPLQVPAATLGLDLFSGSLEKIIAGLYDQSSMYRRSLSPERRHLFDEYRLVDIARRVVGVGSVGTRCYIMLLLGRDPGDPLILQVKEAEASVLERFAGKSPYQNHGERVVVGQKLTQSASDLFLGWTSNTLPDGTVRSFYLRQFRDWKASIEYAELAAAWFETYGTVCAWALAKAHARSGDQIAMSSYMGTGTTFDEAMLSFALAYADQTVVDHNALLAAIKSGRVQAVDGV